MSEWKVVALDPKSWVDRTLGSRRIAAAPAEYGGPTRLLGELVEFVPVRERLDSHRVVVTPQDINTLSGKIMRMSIGKSETGCSMAQDLATGDVLVPRCGSGPCLLVTTELVELAFSQFLALRTLPGFAPWVLWAALSSRSGTDARLTARGSTTNSVLRPHELAAIAVPALSPPEAARIQAEVEVLLPKPAIELASPVVKPSEWAKVELNVAKDWWHPVAMLGLEVENGPELADVAKLRTGRTSLGNVLELRGPGLVPVATARWIRTGQVANWLPKGCGIVTSPGSLVLSTDGQVRARCVHEPMALGQKIVEITPTEGSHPRLADALVAYFNSDAGQLIVSRLSLGTAARRLRLADLSRIRLPELDRLFRYARSPASNDELSAKLEEILWAS